MNDEPFVNLPPDKEQWIWDITSLDPARMHQVAKAATENLEILNSVAQQSVLTAVRDLPPDALVLDAIVECALGLDATAVEDGAWDADVMAVARAILLRSDVQPFINVSAVLDLLADIDEDYTVRIACVKLLEGLSADRFVLWDVCNDAGELDPEADDDGDGCDEFLTALVDLLVTQERWDVLAAYASGDEDSTEFAQRCHAALQTHGHLDLITPADNETQTV
jgi:hypothetical protein